MEMCAPFDTATTSEPPYSDKLSPHLIPSSKKQHQATKSTTGINRSPRPRHRSRSIIDMHPNIHHPTQHIRPRESIQKPRLQPSNIAHNHRGRKNPYILEAILLRAFGTDDGVLGGLVEGLVLVQAGDEVAGLGRVDLFLGRFGVVVGDGVQVRDEAEEPGDGDGVDGEVGRHFSFSEGGIGEGVWKLCWEGLHGC